MQYKSYQEYRWSPEWRAKRDQVRERSGGVCERCGNHDADHVHHTHYRTLYHESVTDGTLQHLCVGCHAWVHGKSQVDPKDYGADWLTYFQAVLAEI